MVSDAFITYHVKFKKLIPFFFLVLFSFVGAVFCYYPAGGKFFRNWMKNIQKIMFLIRTGTLTVAVIKICVLPENPHSLSPSLSPPCPPLFTEGIGNSLEWVMGGWLEGRKLNSPPHSFLQKGLEIPGSGWWEGDSRGKSFIGIFIGVGVRKNPFHGGGIDNLWNYTAEVRFSCTCRVIDYEFC